MDFNTELGTALPHERPVSKMFGCRWSQFQKFTLLKNTNETGKPCGMRHTNSSKVGNRGKREGQKNQRDCFDNNKQDLSKPATKKINKQMKNSLSNGINQ